MSTINQNEDFLHTGLSTREVDELKLEVGTFVLAQRNLRPIVVVTSGGTAVDLEVRAVRTLDNFSTGLRGAISVEEFLRRGYAVIHLWREGSASPFARVLGQLLELKQSNHGLSVESLGRLFSIAGENQDDDLVQSVLEKDPWLTSNNPVELTTSEPYDNRKKDEIALNRGLVHSSDLHKALRERSNALFEGRLLTVPFRTIEQYLAKLQLCAQSVSSTKSLSMFFLAAAVSDFYVPFDQKSEHKIQSGSNEDGLVLKLQPVPKVMGVLRKEWAPDSFVVAFKLETDQDILRQKTERAVEKYGCHMVIGNLLHSRHEKVSILAPKDFTTKNPSTATDWPLIDIVKARGSSAETLESSIIDFVVESHFEYISWHFNTDGSAVKAAKQVQRRLREEQEQLERDIFWKKAKKVSYEIAGAVLTVWLSYSINSAIQRRIHGG